MLGPLRLLAVDRPEVALDSAGVADLVAPLTDEVLRRRARHVITENARVRVFADALRRLDLEVLGPLLAASHASLRDDFEVSTPILDALVERLVTTPGVLGARLTGAGFGGCVVALTEPGALEEGWRVHAGPGAHRFLQQVRHEKIALEAANFDLRQRLVVAHAQGDKAAPLTLITHTPRNACSAWW